MWAIVPFQQDANDDSTELEEQHVGRIRVAGYTWMKGKARNIDLSAGSNDSCLERSRKGRT
jgi:hypothetical protein